jgi:endoglucanase
MATLLEKHNIGWSWWTYKKVNNTANPCSVPEPANYGQILEYVNGRGSQPPQSTGATIMLALASNAATVNCTWNNGLVQALFGVPAN